MFQDWYFAAAGLILSAVLIPSMLDQKTEIPRRSSLLTATILSCSAVVYLSMGFWLASASTLIGAGVWGFLAWRRPIRGVELPKGASLTPVISEEEIAVVMEYRVWRSKQAMLEYLNDRLNIPPSECGVCPSKGGCSDE